MSLLCLASGPFPAQRDLNSLEKEPFGWSIVIYELRIEEQEDGRACYEVVEETESLGEQTLVWSEDPEDAACWIEEMVEGGREGI